MYDLDKLVKERFVPFRGRLTEIFRSKHPYMLSFLQAVMGEKRSKVGLRITEGGQTAGEYTFHLTGINITGVEGGKLESAVEHPFLGLVRPYVTIERAALERLIDDAKPLTRHLIGLDISLEAQGRIYIGSGQYDGDIVTVYPYLPDVIETRGGFGLPGREHTIDQLSVYPWP